MSTPASQNEAAKTVFRRSKQGCLNCKFRKVKCDELKPICGSCSRMHLSCGGWSTTLSKSEYAKQKTAFLELLKAGCAHRDARPPTIRRKRKAAVMEQGEASGQQQQGLLAGQENGSALVPSQNLTMMDDMLASTPRHPLHDSSQQGDRLGLPNLLDTTTPAFPRTAQVVADFQSRLDAALAIQGQQTQSASTLGTQTQPAHDDPATTNLFEMDPRTAATLQMAQQQAAIAQAQATLSYSDPATASSTPLDAQGAVLATSRDQVPYVPSMLAIDSLLTHGQQQSAPSPYPMVHGGQSQGNGQGSKARMPPKIQKQRAQRGVKVAQAAAAVAASLKAQEEQVRLQHAQRQGLVMSAQDTISQRGDLMVEAARGVGLQQPVAEPLLHMSEQRESRH